MLHAADIRLLWLLCYGPPHTLREIAEALGLEQSTVNRQVNTALRAGLVERFAQEGRAALVVTPTAEGRRRFQVDMDQSLTIHRTALAVLGEEQDTFLRLLTTFTQGFAENVDALVDHGRPAAAAESHS